MPAFIDNAITFAISLALLVAMTLAGVKIGENVMDQHQQLMAERQRSWWRIPSTTPRSNTFCNQTVYAIVLASMFIHATRCLQPSRTTTFRGRVYSSITSYIGLLTLAGSVAGLYSYINDPASLMTAVQKLVVQFVPVLDRMRAEWERGAAQRW